MSVISVLWDAVAEGFHVRVQSGQINIFESLSPRGKRNVAQCKGYGFNPQYHNHPKKREREKRNQMGFFVIENTK